MSNGVGSLTGDSPSIGFIDELDQKDIDTPAPERVGNFLCICGRYLSYLFWKGHDYAIYSQSELSRCWKQQEGCDCRITKIVKEVLKLVFGVALCLSTFPLFLAGQSIDYLTTKLVMNHPYMYLKGEHEENPPDKKLSFLTLNVCEFPGGLPGSFGGMFPGRIPRLVEDIKGKETYPDVFCSQEVGLEAAMEMYDKLRKHYATFIFHIGPDSFRMENALFFATNAPICSDPVYIDFKIEGRQPGIRRGAFFVETPEYWICMAHLEPGDRTEARKKELELIVEKMKGFSKKKKCILLGDLNSPRGGEEYGIIKENFIDLYEKKYPKLNAQSATNTDYFEDWFKGKEKPQENWSIVDYALFYKFYKDKELEVSQIEQEFEIDNVPTFQMDGDKIINPKNADSDHRGIILTPQ